MNLDTESTVRTLVADGKGILAADETPGTLTKRLDALGIRSTEQSRRAYREMLFTAPGAATSISGVIMPEITSWKWGQGAGASAGGRSTEADNV